MAKNDFTPIVYNILCTLYYNLKHDKENDVSIFDKEKYGISYKYMDLIIDYLMSENYISGIGRRWHNVFEFDNLEITPKGIIHLENILISDKKEELYPYDISSYDFTTFKEPE